MTNAIILRRITALYNAGRIDDRILERYVTSGIITAAQAAAIRGDGA